MVERDQVWIKLYAIYTLFSSIFAGLSYICADLTIDPLDIHTVYLLAMTPNLIIFIFTVFTFKEQKQQYWLPESQNLRTMMLRFSSLVMSPLLFLLTLLTILIFMTPNAAHVTQSIIASGGGWTHSQLYEANIGLLIVIGAFLLQAKKFGLKGKFEQILFL